MADEQQQTQAEPEDWGGLDVDAMQGSSTQNLRDAIGRTDILAMTGRSDVSIADDEAYGQVVDALLEGASQKLNKRFSGMQSLVDRRFAEMTAKLEAIAGGEVPGTSQEEQEAAADALLEQRQNAQEDEDSYYDDEDDSVDQADTADQQPVPTGDDEVDRLRFENWLMRQQEERPVGAGLLGAISQAETADQQIETIENWVGQLVQQVLDQQAQQQGVQPQAGQPSAEPPEQPVADVDRNNPPRSPQMGLETAVSTGQMSDDVADALLSHFDQKGVFVRDRR